MSQPFEESLLQAIKKDDIKAFNALTENARRGAYRLGRFPVPSLLYLYKSRKILSAYEEQLLKITDYEPLREPAEVSGKFSEKAGKCLRLYLNEVVSPHEMLLILDKTRRLKRIYPLTKQSEAVKERLKLIYAIKYSLNVKFEGDGIIIDRRPLSYREKRNVVAACLCCVFGVSIAVGVPVATVALLPEPVEGEVTKLSQIDFNSREEYVITRDIYLTENYTVEKVNCKISGKGGRLILEKGATLGELNGEISDLTISSSGGAVFTSVSEKGLIQNVTVNVTANVAAALNTAFVVQTNYGTVDGVTVNVSGQINARASSDISELTLGGIAQNNSYKYSAAAQTVYRGVIKNCTVNYSRFSLVGEPSANAAFGGVAGVNGGYLQDCTVNGEIVADTFDVAGVCAVNNGMLTGNVNAADISQTSTEIGWNPISCGIVLSNTYAVENCENRGNISAVSDCGQPDAQGNEPTATSAGIAYMSSGNTSAYYISDCVNYGKIECSARHRNVYAAGICTLSNVGISGCKNEGSVTATADSGCDAYVGGIIATAYGNVYKSVNGGAISVTCGGTAYVGGISANACALLSYCLSDGDISVAAQKAYAGGILAFCESTKSGWSIYYGAAYYCISECKLDVSSPETAFVGGVAGYVSETEGVSGIYYGGAVNCCYFIGEYASENEYFGNIVGSSGAYIYENNSFDNSGNHNFDKNYYTINGYNACGATVSGDVITVPEDKDIGAYPATFEEIKNSEQYNLILTELGIARD